MLTASELYARTVNVGLELDSDGVSLSATAIVEFHSQFFLVRIIVRVLVPVRQKL